LAGEVEGCLGNETETMDNLCLVHYPLSVGTRITTCTFPSCFCSAYTQPSYPSVVFSNSRSNTTMSWTRTRSSERVRSTSSPYATTFAQSTSDVFPGDTVVMPRMTPARWVHSVLNNGWPLQYPVPTTEDSPSLLHTFPTPVRWR
jgi:hypothetical protein